MKFCVVILVSLLALIGATAAAQETTTFTVFIDNVSGFPKFENNGLVDTPVGADAPATLGPGEAYEIVFPAFMAERFSFAIGVAGGGNDLFVATEEVGIELYDPDGGGVEGDITDELLLLDLGTQQDGSDENGVVRAVSELNAEQTPAISDIIQVTVTQLEPTGFGDGDFNFRLENVSGGTAFETEFTPAIWALHFEPGPFFMRGEIDYGEGLEALVEDGDSGPLMAVVGGGDLSTAVTPVVWGLFREGANPLFTPGQTDHGQGLEALAETGDAGTLTGNLDQLTFQQADVAAIPVSASGPGAAPPGFSYIFSFRAEAGDRLAFASMLAESNDLFFGPGADGIALFDADGNPRTGDATRYVTLWDLGTEVNEEPGVGANQAPRQPDSDAGEAENGVVRPIGEVNDGYSYPPVAALIRVIVTVEEG